MRDQGGGALHAAAARLGKDGAHMPWRTLGALALIVVGVGAVVVAVFRPTFASSDTTQYITSQAATTNVVDAAVADGTLAAAQTYGLSFGTDPRLVDSSASSTGGGSAWLVDDVKVIVGQKVVTGDVLAVADSTDQQRAVDLAQANLESAQARYDADTGGPTATDQQSAQISVDQAQQQLTSAQKSRDDTKKQNDIKLSQAQSAVSDARQQLRDDRKANAPSSVIDADKQQLSQAQDSRDLTKAQIDASNRQASEQVASAELALESAQNSYDSHTAPATDEVIAADHAALLQAQQALDDAQRALDGATLVAPVDGTISTVNIVPGAVTPSSDAIQMTTAQMEVAAEFAESDVPSLAPGQKATVTISAIGDEVSGTVLAVEPVASTSGASSVVSYSVRVGLDNVPAKALAGMSAQVSVTIEEADKDVAVPSIALIGRAGSYSLQIVNADGSVSLRQVDVGLITSSLAEIRSGVAAGEEIVTGTASSLNSSSGTGFPGGGLNGVPGGGTFRNGGQRIFTP